MTGKRIRIVEYSVVTWSNEQQQNVNKTESGCKTDERDNGIVLAATAMLDGGLGVGKTVALLLKHWDLRPSEANHYVGRALCRLKVSA